MALEKMLAGLSSRRYRAGLEPAGQAVEETAAATSKPGGVAPVRGRDRDRSDRADVRRLDDLDLVAFMADGVHFGEHTCVVALGIDSAGVKHPLAIEEGSTENATLVTDLITGLRERGLDVTKPILAVLDGAKDLSRAVKDVFDKPLVQSCQQHKIRNVRGPAAGQLRTVRGTADAPGLPCRVRAEGRGPAAGAGPRAGQDPPRRRRVLREGMAETLTILRLDGHPPWPARCAPPTRSSP